MEGFFTGLFGAKKEKKNWGSGSGQRLGTAEARAAAPLLRPARRPPPPAPRTAAARPAG